MDILERKGPSSLRPLAAAAVLAGLFFAPSPVSAAPACPGGDQPARVSVRTDAGKVTYRSGHTRSDLERIQKRHRGAGKAGAWFPLGITLANVQIDMRMTVSTFQLGRSRYCAVPATVEITMAYPEFLVYIDRRYRRGTCEYRAIRDHEDTHVAIYREKLARYGPWVRERMERAVRGLEPVIMSTPGHVQERVKARLEMKIAPIIDKFHRITDLANAEIDKVSDYRGIQARCGNW